MNIYLKIILGLVIFGFIEKVKFVPKGLFLNLTFLSCANSVVIEILMLVLLTKNLIILKI